MNEHDLADAMESALAEAHRAAARAKRVSADLADLRGTGRSLRGEVTAEVDYRGLLQDVTFTHAALRLDTDGLRSAILQTVGAAQADLQEQAAELRGSLRSDPRPISEQTETFDVAERIMRGE
ncbi:YbaB/EbfC family nucleoid-associated protein [Sanguibacter antarcticus]|uniref:YbaB/EbfC DNA-binding family protein n=1 Tax=Sanguibacter antarcticus TaxID=372484 RepID=A0A2A9E6G8_9MICO|nr:YbaB/EbfC family nucleoid-associated protein [Sanguibacter antarcticus]PFG34424.1 YbaB/EbfC DNA-binding family protein [Sanguibacter antarcticus]